MRKTLFFFLFAFLLTNTYAQTKADVLEAGQQIKLKGITYDKLANIVTSIQQLRATKAITGSTVHWIDSTRGGDFIVYPKTGFKIDSGMVIPNADTNYVMVRNTSMTNYYNVKWFGAKGDGVTDDWDAVNRAINALPSYSGGSFAGTLYFPPGVFYLTKNIRLQKAIRMIGESGFIRDVSTLLFENGLDGIIECAPIAADSLHPAVGSAQGYAIENLTIYQKDGTKTIGNGIWSRVRGTIREVSVRNWAGPGVFLNANGVPAANYNKIQVIDVNQPGSYTDSVPPTVTITPVNGGSGALAHAVLGAKVISLALADTGYRYVLRPIIKIEKDTILDRNTMHTVGWGATAAAILQLDTIPITNGGSGYHTATVSFVGASYIPATGEIMDSSTVVGDTALDNTAGGGLGNVQVNIVNGQVTGIVLTNRGEYATVPKVVISGDGTGATAKAYASIKRLIISDIGGGSWWEARDTPTVHFIGGHEGGDVLARDAKAKVTAYGKWVLKRVEVDNQGNNYYVEPTITLSGGHPVVQGTARAIIGRDMTGNANQFLVDKVRSVANSVGIRTRGSDVNAGNVNSCDFSFNLQMGIWAEDFLGNTYNGGHATANIVTPIYAISATGFNKFTNSYEEGNQPPIIALRPSIFEGGDHGAGFVQKASGANVVRSNINGVSSAVTIQNQLSNQVHTIGLGTNSTNGNILTSTFTNFGNTYYLPRQSTSTGDLIWSYGNTEALGGILRMNGARTTINFGRDSTVPFATAIKNLFLGTSGSNWLGYNNLTYTTTYPVPMQEGQKNWKKGDIAFFSNMNPGNGIFGYYRMTGGSGSTLYTDWYPLSVGVVNQNSDLQSGATMQTLNYYIGSTNPSVMTNNGGVPVTPNPNITGGGLHLIPRNVDGSWTMLDIYSKDNTSGLHIASPFSNSSVLATGGYYNQLSGINGNYFTLETTMYSLAAKDGNLYFQNRKGLTPYTETMLDNIAQLNEVGLNLTGNTPDAGLHLKLGTATNAPLKFSMTGAAKLATPVRGVLEPEGNYLYWTDSTLNRDTVATRGWVNNKADLKILSTATVTTTLADFTASRTLLLVNYTGGTATVTLPAAANNTGKTVTIKTISANGVTIVGGFSNDPATIAAGSYGAETWTSTGTTWYLISKL